MLEEHLFLYCLLIILIILIKHPRTPPDHDPSPMRSKNQLNQLNQRLKN